MTFPARAAAALSALAAVVLIAGCTIGPGSTSPQSTSLPSSTPIADDIHGDIEGALLDDGRMFAVVTWGSSTCIPQVDTVTAEGQNVSVELVDTDADAVCTMDMVQRASLGGLPAGVDPTQDITLQVTYKDANDDVELEGAAVAGTPGEPTEYQSSAGWFDDDALVLVTWGSSGCPPVVASVEGSGNAGTVEFTTIEGQVCTMDMAPRATIVAFADGAVDDGEFTLTLSGGNLDGTVSVPARD